nr:MAG TPA: hypothetical protein [Bacteriophage sp.]
MLPLRNDIANLGVLKQKALSVSILAIILSVVYPD